ncbi:pentatricopeptide repeat-containing protein, mitochondrial [Trifolium repens]|nr:pentatricopeptide repeat-containing protein, mitochondrial [Trifolium repens]
MYAFPKLKHTLPHRSPAAATNTISLNNLIPSEKEEKKTILSTTTNNRNPSRHSRSTISSNTFNPHSTSPALKKTRAVKHKTFLSDISSNTFCASLNPPKTFEYESTRDV